MKKIFQKALLKYIYVFWKTFFVMQKYYFRRILMEDIIYILEFF